MIICSDRNFAFLATPKTGSTAIETALRPHADIVFKRRRKHLNAQQFHKKIKPFFDDGFGMNLHAVALMREPVDQLRSWYKYRSRSQRAGDPRSTVGMSFDDFIDAFLRPDPPEYAQVGRQGKFLLLSSGELGVNRLFAYEKMELFLEYLEDVFGEPLVPPVQNVSPHVEALLSEDRIKALRAALPDEFALYDQLCAAGGHFVKPDQN
jgi:hypothetical protein